MKLLTFSIVVLCTLATFHDVSCQEEITTTVAPQVLDETAAKETTETPTPVETAPVESITAKSESESTEAPPESTATEEKPKGEEKKDEPSEETVTDAKDETKEEVASERQPKEQGSENEGGEMPQDQPKFVFVTQHFRDPITGVVYTRQVPLIPSNFLRPLPNQPDVRRAQPVPSVQAQPEIRPQEAPAGGPSFDPLGQYNEQQKKRQFYQDMIMTQLTRFEKEIEPMLENEQNVTQKNDMEELLGTVSELKLKLEHHQIFNISEIMNNWKQGKLSDGQNEPQPSYTGPRQPIPPQGAPMQSPGYNRPRPDGPPVTLRALILVPQTRVMNQQQPQYNPYPSMSRQVPMIHTMIRRGPYQPVFDSEGRQHQHQPVGRPTEHIEPQPAGGEEYSNTNDIFGY